jgi:thiaminase (transcriptional activator TenA)
MTFTDDAWARTAALRGEIERLAFLTELAEGTLAPAAFRHYLEQDALYLAGYAKALDLLAARAPDAAAASFWASSAHTTGVVEAQLHHDLLDGGLLGPSAGHPVPSPSCLAYVSYLIACAATESYAVAAAAVLPCYWVYADTGARLAATARGTADHPYLRWVAAYDDPGFRAATGRGRALVDDAAAGAPQDVPAMHRSFGTATRYELHFWRSAHVQEAWPHPLG